MSNHYLFLTGDPGSGKSTWGKQFAREQHVSYLSTGDYIRETGRAASIASGSLGPSNVVQRGVERFVASHPAGVVDGYPREIEQAHYVVELQRWTYVAVLVFRVDVEQAIARYANLGWLRSAVSGDYGPRGHRCKAGGLYAVDDVAEHYRRRRQQQARALQETLDVLQASDVPVRDAWSQELGALPN